MTTFVLGLLLSLTFGLLLIPISLIWVVLFLGPLLSLSYVYERVTILRPFIAVMGIPLAVMGDIYVSLIPTMGEIESRLSKLVLCQTFPYTWKFTQLQKGKENIKNGDVLAKILKEVSKTTPLSKYLDELRADVYSRPENMDVGYKLDW